MKINTIGIQNFGVIADMQLDLSSPEGRLVFVNGSNGRGKTTFLSAVTWCFYNILPPETKFLSKHSLGAAKTGDYIEVSVKVELSMDADNQIAYIERKQIFEKTSNKEFRKVGQSELIVKTKSDAGGGYTDVEVKPEIWLKNYFPERFINFFLFDGEKMANFFEKNVRSAIEDAIREIAGVDHFDAISRKLQSYEAELNREISKLTGEKAEKANQDLVNKRKILAQVLTDKKDAEANLHADRSRREDVMARLGDTEGLAAASQRIGNLDREIESVAGRLQIAETELQGEVLARGTTGLLSSCFAVLHEQVKKAEEEDRLPPPFEPARVQQLIDDQKCLCGNHLAPDTEATKALQLIIERYKVASDIGRILDKAHRQIEKVEAEQAAGWKLIENRNKTVIEMSGKLTSLKEEKESLLIKLQGHDAAAIRLFSEEKRLLDFQIEERIKEITRFDQEIERYILDIERLNKEFQKYAQAESKTEGLRKKAELVKQVHIAASSIHQLAIAQVRSQLEVAVTEMFSTVKEGSFKTEITENFEVNTLHPDGSPAELSEGEKMMKAYVFSIALRQVIKLGLPLVVDTPLGRLDQYNQNELAMMLSKFLQSEKLGPGLQVIFSMQDTEYTPYTQKAFAPVQPIVTYLGFTSEDLAEKLRATLGTGVDPDWLKLTAWKDWKEGKIA